MNQLLMEPAEDLHERYEGARRNDVVLEIYLFTIVHADAIKQGD